MADIAIRSKISPKLIIFASEVSISVGDQKPRDEGTCHGKRRADQEDSLQSLSLAPKRVLDWSKDFCTNGSTSFPNSRSQAEEMTADGSREGFGAAQECRDL